MIDTILFDFDGTLMDTNNIIIESWQHTFRTLEGREESLERLIPTFGEPLSRTMAEFFPNIPVEESIEVYRSFQRDHFTGYIELFPGVKEMVHEAKAAGYKTAIVTSRLVNTTTEALTKFGIIDDFDVIVTPEDTDKHKPDPEPALVALRKLGAKPENAVMLGDTMFDILCANNAGVKSVLVGWTFALKGWTDEDFGDDKPSLRLENPEDLITMLRNE
ncbi:MAG: HAD-IA family hydrolase [Eubacterium sp.]|nr:HAD-IA family hydrolase [Candidatus Colimonas fimequi]